jgi:nicotinamide-nucleotide amidase
MDDQLSLNSLEKEAKEILELCQKANLRITTAESCTGGLIVSFLTEIAGSSAVVGRSFVTYSNEAKQEMLGVPADTLENFGAVSKETVQEMTSGALASAGADADIAIAVSGVAGPGGGSADKPVGTVWLCVEKRGEKAFSEKHIFPGDRRSIRLATVKRAFEMVREKAL